MRNSVERPGVYCNMRWFLLLTVLEFAAMAQAPRAPMDAALQSAMQAPFGQKAALREEARALFETAPADDPRFGRWAQSVAQLYEQAGYGAQGRAVLQEALERTAGSSASRIAILDALGSAWEQDGNLLKALPYLEQSAAAEPAAPASNAAVQPGLRGVIVSSLSGPFASSRISAYAPAGSFRYIRLANLYKRLGKPDAVEAMAAKIRAVATNPEEVATFYQQMGQLDEAAAAYQQAAAAAKDPEAQINGWQGLANVYSTEQRFADAAAALQHAVAVAQQAGTPGIGNQALWIRQELAGLLQRAGQTGQADEVYAQVLRESQGTQQESQLLAAYANYLAQTKRGAEGEQVLKSYLDSNPNLEPWQQNNLLFGLANVARQNGDAAAAEQYQKAAQALQPAQPSSMQTESDRDLEQAQTAINQHRLDDAFTLALAGIDAAASAPAGQQVVWRAPGIAEALAGQKQPARAEQIFERLLGVAQNWSTENMQPLATVTQAYARFLTNQRDRWNEVPAAIERYRSVLISANGADSGQLAEPLRLSMEFEQRRGDKQNAIAAAQKLLKFQESLSGNTSEPYLTDLQNAARAYESAGDTQGALPLLRQAVAISDLLGGTPNDWRRAGTRSELAYALARAGQFDEAETVMQEAARLAKPAGQFVQQLQQIREMKARATAADNGGPPRG
jgi:hypothetical protein